MTPEAVPPPREQHPSRTIRAARAAFDRDRARARRAGEGTWTNRLRAEIVERIARGSGTARPEAARDLQELIGAAAERGLRARTVLERVAWTLRLRAARDPGNAGHVEG